MTNNSKTTSASIIGAVVGAVVSVFIYSTWFQAPSTSSGSATESAEKKPLYWVSPMNPDYKRDKPGKSPMGMDLIPFYDDGGGGADAGPGTIRISADVVNNLGVRTAVAERTTLHSEIRTVGYVQYDEDKLVHIHPRVKGWIETLYVKAAGDPVKKGQPLYDIYSPELVNAQEEMVLAMDRKNQRLVKAAKDRLTALQIPKRAITALQKNKVVKQTVTFYAPQSGVVDHLKVRQGFYVMPGTTIMSIGALDQVWVEAEVFERQASEVSNGSPVTMTLDFLPGREWRGKVDYVYPTLDAKTRTLKVRLRFENSDGQLKPNMFAQVLIHASSDEETLLVPREAVIRTGSMDRVVLALGDGQFKSIAVKLGRLNSEFAEILSGLNDGESVVTSAQFLLDSESNKTSDFKRMNHDDLSEDNAGMDMNMNMDGAAMDKDMDMNGAAMDMDSAAMDRGDNSASAMGTVNSVMAAHRMLNISRGPIEKWNKPAATLDFIAAESVDLGTVKEGMEVHFQFEINEGQYIVTDIRPMPTSE